MACWIVEIENVRCRLNVGVPCGRESVEERQQLGDLIGFAFKETSRRCIEKRQWVPCFCRLQPSDDGEERGGEFGSYQVPEGL